MEKFKGEIVAGTRIGSLVVLEAAKETRKHRRQWLCACDCGSKTIVREAKLIQGYKSCGCATARSVHPGDVFGELTALADTGLRTNRKSIVWECLCSCGQKRNVPAEYLREGNTQTCGCSKLQKIKRHTVRKLRLRNVCKGYEEISNDYFSKLKSGAISRNLEFSITIEYTWDLFITQNRCCALSSTPLTFAKSRTDRLEHQTASLDRIDSSKGYIIGNVQWVNKKLNNSKSNYSQDYFIELCCKISKFNETTKSVTNV